MGIFRRKPVDLAALVGELEPEERANLFANAAQPPTYAQLTGGLGAAGVPVTLDSMISIPAVSAAIRFLAETISMLPLNVYKGRGADKTLADQTWQYRLLAELPGMGDFTPVDLISDIVSCVEWEGNAFLKKVKATNSNFDRMPEVIGLMVIDPLRVEVRREGGEKIFRIREQLENGGTKQKDYSQSDILHIRGWTPAGSDRGYAVIHMNRDKLSAILAQSIFQGKFFKQGMLKPFGLEVPGIIQDPQRHEQNIQAQLGLQAAGRPFTAENGAKIVETGMTMRESQFVEGDRQNMIHVAHMFRIPPGLLVHDPGRQVTTEDEMIRFYTLGIQPRCRRIEMALFSDSDLFPQRVIYPEFDTAHLIRADAATMAEVDLKRVQAGIDTRDEVRARDGKAPLPNGAGSVVPETPTGAGGPAGGKQGDGQPQDQQPADAPAN